jgi:mannosyl-3-phosphoglycerate phosphatase
MIVVFTDLDGTLLDHDSYSFEAAKPALALLKARGIALILASSKTEAEMRPLSLALGMDYPLIVENGAGIANWRNPERGGDDSPSRYQRIRLFLAALPQELRGCFAGFGDWSVEEVALATGLSLEAAALAKQRNFSEPGHFTGSDVQRHAFLALLEAAGFQAIQGGRFFTVMPRTSKAVRMAELVAFYRRQSGEAVVSVALGDAPNDLAMLQAADLGIIIANPSHTPLPVTERERQGLILRSEEPGPAGWNRMIHHLVATGLL